MTSLIQFAASSSVRKLLWLAPLKPDTAFSASDLSKCALEEGAKTKISSKLGMASPRLIDFRTSVTNCYRIEPCLLSTHYGIFRNAMFWSLYLTSSYASLATVHMKRNNHTASVVGIEGSLD